MNDNCYIDWTKEKFIDVLEGKDSDYIQNDDSQRFSDHKVYRSTLSSEPTQGNYSIYIPTQPERYKHKLIDSYSANQSTKYTNVESLIVYRISEKINWDRNANLNEDSKSVLTFGINLLNFEFQDTFSILNVRSKGTLIIDNCTFTSSESTDKNLEICYSKFDSVDIIGNTRVDQGEKKSLKEIDINCLEANRLLISGLTIDKLIINCEYS